MNSTLTPVQRLAVSRTMLAKAMREPVWLMLMRRVLNETAQGKAPSASRSP